MGSGAKNSYKSPANQKWNKMKQNMGSNKRSSGVRGPPGLGNNYSSGKQQRTPYG
jgi:hypothetical protein